nr:THAP domain-containing protein 1-like [Labrus bergylta]
MCSVVGCYSGHIGVQRFKLPEDPDRRFEWVQFLFEVNEQRFKESDWTDITICRAHFTKDCFVKPTCKNGTAQLKSSAVPSLFIKANTDEAPEDAQSPEMASDEDVFSETDTLNGKEGHTSEEEEEDDQDRVSSDEDWNPTHDFLPVKASEEESEEEEEEKKKKKKMKKMKKNLITDGASKLMSSAQSVVVFIVKSLTHVSTKLNPSPVTFAGKDVSTRFL